MPEILVIAPQREIIDIVNGLGFPRGEVATTQARMEQGVAVALGAVASGARVLVSRGLTQRMIADALPDIPCVEIKVSGYDVLRAYLQAAAIGGRIAVVDRREVIEGFASMENIQKVDNATLKVILNDSRDVSAGVAQAISGGATCIVGNQAVVQEAEARGLQAVLVQSGLESVKVAMQTARSILGRLHMQETSARQIDTIINTVDYGILAIDGHGAITAINTEARRLLYRDKDGKKQEGTLVAKMVAAMKNSQKKTGLIEKFDPHTEVVVNYHPIIIQGRAVGLVATLQELKQLQDIEQTTRRELALRGRVAKHSFDEIQSNVPAMQRVLNDSIRFAGYDSPLLILGETGVGKEYFAHAIHNASRRKNGPFVAINCASIPESILESELFGHAEGAFTGAKRGGKMGLFEQAHGGTIFLDEIGEMLGQCQVRLLRVLQEYEVYRLGDNRTIPVDIRVIAATNRDLWRLVQEKKFREDLYYRLEVLTIDVPPLRERKADIEMFTRHFIEQCNRQYHTNVSGIAPEGEAVLRGYDWPGNIRELQNILGRLVALAENSVITAEEVRRSLKDRLQNPAAEQGLRDAEFAVIQQTLQKTGGNRQLAADLLGISRATLWRKLKNTGN